MDDFLSKVSSLKPFVNFFFRCSNNFHVSSGSWNCNWQLLFFQVSPINFILTFSMPEELSLPSELYLIYKLFSIFKFYLFRMHFFKYFFSFCTSFDEMLEIDPRNLRLIVVISHTHLPVLEKARKKRVVMKDWHTRYVEK